MYVTANVTVYVTVNVTVYVTVNVANIEVANKP